ncbi:hypothetical protein QZJ86_04685 [Methylomonas montana]|uniref:hypothetical protein n=1 Tax=Methylomonas montana TaxID=3058963 RepID=UPI002659D7F7|nr:hypothetical protein [Methylomonas montana]WKJ91433.1 hypothetical protein QZJ86_04685 [Methylomonas montana]
MKHSHSPDDKDIRRTDLSIAERKRHQHDYLPGQADGFLGLWLKPNASFIVLKWASRLIKGAGTMPEISTEALIICHSSCCC